MPDQQNTTTRNISLYPEQVDVLEQVAKDIGGNFSAAVRYIVSDWVRSKAPQYAPPAPQSEYPAD